MASGLKIWNASGALILDTSDRVSRVFGTLALGDGHGAGSITNADFATGTPFAAVLGTQRYNESTGALRVLTQTSFSGNTLNYTAGDACTILYGVY